MLYDFHADSNERSQISVKKGERVEVRETSDDGWSEVVRYPKRDGEGIVPTKYLKIPNGGVVHAPVYEPPFLPHLAHADEGGYQAVLDDGRGEEAAYQADDYYGRYDASEEEDMTERPNVRISVTRSSH